MSAPVRIAALLATQKLTVAEIHAACPDIPPSRIHDVLGKWLNVDSEWCEARTENGRRQKRYWVAEA